VIFLHHTLETVDVHTVTVPVVDHLDLVVVLTKEDEAPGTIGTEAEAVLEIEEITDVSHPTKVEKADLGVHT